MLVLSLALQLATLTHEIVDHRLQIGHCTDQIISGKKDVCMPSGFSNVRHKRNCPTPNTLKLLDFTYTKLQSVSWQRR